ALIWAIRHAPIEPGMPVPKILVIAPPPIGNPKGPIAAKFRGGEEKCRGLAEAYKQICSELSCGFFDAGTVISSSTIDGVHLDADQHIRLGQALDDIVASII